MYNKFYEGRTLVHDPKPAYKAAQTLTRLLKGMVFKDRLPIQSSIQNKTELYAAAFEPANHDVIPKDREHSAPDLGGVLVAWCSNYTLIPCPMKVAFGTAHACYDMIDYTGQPLPQICTDSNGTLDFVADNAPLYFIPAQ